MGKFAKKEVKMWQPVLLGHSGQGHTGAAMPRPISNILIFNIHSGKTS